MTDPLPAAEPYVLSILVMPAQTNTLDVMALMAQIGGYPD